MYPNSLSLSFFLSLTIAAITISAAPPCMGVFIAALKPWFDILLSLFISLISIHEQFIQISESPQQCLWILLIPCYPLHPILPILHLLPLSKPSIYCLLCFPNLTLPIFRKTLSRLTISYRKIQNLCFPPLGCILIFYQRHRSLTLWFIPFHQHIPLINLLLNFRIHCLIILKILTKTVLEWKSPPLLKASIIVLQLVIWASTLNSNYP